MRLRVGIEVRVSLTLLPTKLRSEINCFNKIHNNSRPILSWNVEWSEIADTFANSMHASTDLVLTSSSDRHSIFHLGQFAVNFNLFWIHEREKIEETRERKNKVIISNWSSLTSTSDVVNKTDFDHDHIITSFVSCLVSLIDGRMTADGARTNILSLSQFNFNAIRVWSCH